MGGGGTTGTVVYPGYIADVHGYLYAGVSVKEDGEFRDDTPAGAAKPWWTPNLSVTSIMNTLWGVNPYSGFGWTDPAIDLAAMQTQFNLFYSGVTAYHRDNYSDYISDAILAIGNSTTVPIADLVAALSTSALSTPQTLYSSYVGAGRTAAAANLTSMFNAVQPDVQALMIDAPSTALAAVTLTAATTMWDSLVDTVSTKLQTCGIPKNANLLTILTKAAQDAEQNLRTAITLTKKFIDDGLIGDLANEFASRREIDFAQQHRQYAGQMADINAINSTGFLFGTALLKAEQLREVGEYDKELSLNQFQQGLSAYIQMHTAGLNAGLQVESQNAEAHNRLLEASIQLLTTLNTRGEILPSDLVNLYGQFFSAELGMFDADLRDATGGQAGLFGVTSNNQLQRDSSLAQLSLDADRINKLAKEQRFSIGMSQIQGLLANRLEFEKAAATVLTEQKRIDIVATKEYDTVVNDTSVEEDLWDLTVAREGANIMVAPGGMGSAVPRKNSSAASVIGGALQGAGSAAVASGGNPFATIAGGVGGALQGL